MEGASAQQQVQANPFQPLPQEQQQQAPEGFGSAGARRRAVGTLDETVWATLMRDARRVAVNTKCVCNSLRVVESAKQPVDASLVLSAGWDSPLLTCMRALRRHLVAVRGSLLHATSPLGRTTQCHD